LYPPGAEGSEPASLWVFYDSESGVPDTLDFLGDDGEKKFKEAVKRFTESFKTKHKA
jgi:hypothetical protein